jgi:hypothetical protein
MQSGRFQHCKGGKDEPWMLFRLTANDPLSLVMDQAVPWPFFSVMRKRKDTSLMTLAQENEDELVCK